MTKGDNLRQMFGQLVDLLISEIVKLDEDDNPDEITVTGATHQGYEIFLGIRDPAE